MWDFEHGETAARLKQHFEVAYTVPSRCAEDLKEGRADIGIIPVAAYTSIPGLVIIPDIAIAAKKEVRSILLVSKVPVEKIRSVATDDSSRTSAALVEVFLRRFIGIDPGFQRQRADLREMLHWHDAGLLIGDVALQAQTSGYYVYDLAEQWQRWTGRPFVFAFWAVRGAALSESDAGLNVSEVFQQSRNNGLQQIPTIAKSWGPRLDLPVGLISEYLTRNIDYTLDSENLEGLRLFYRYAAEYGVLPAAPEIRFLEQPRLATQA